MVIASFRPSTELRSSTRPAHRSRWAAVGAAVAVSLGAGGLTIASATGGTPSSFVSITPERILDTRTGVGLDGPFTSPAPRVLQVTGGSVPAGATGVVLNVTAVQPTADGFISVRPDGTPGAPETSNLNFSAGDIIPNAVTVALPPSGAIEITYDAFSAPGPTTDILADVTGYYLAGGGGTAGPAGPAGPRGPAGAAAPTPANVVRVATSGTDFTSVQAAIDSISGASAANPYLVEIGPGTFPGHVVLRNHVHLRGAGRDVTILTAPGGGSPSPPTALANGVSTSLTDLSIVNTGGVGSALGIRAVSGADIVVERVTVTVSGGTVHSMAIDINDSTIDANGLYTSAFNADQRPISTFNSVARFHGSRVLHGDVWTTGITPDVTFVASEINDAANFVSSDAAKLRCIATYRTSGGAALGVGCG